MRTRLPAILAAVVVLAGCSAPDGPGSRATSGTATSATTSPPSRPAITRPLDASAYRDRVCDLLTKAQIAEHHMTSVSDIPEQPDEQGRMHCALDELVRVAHARTSITLTYWYAADLLGSAYRDEWYAHRPLVPMTVAGQPALQVDLGDSCKLAIGFANTQGLDVWFRSRDTDMDPCGRAMEVGEDIVRNLAG